MACPSLPSNEVLASALASALYPSPSSIPPSLIPQLLTSFDTDYTSNVALLQSLSCSGLWTGNCTALCPNQDLAGIGVRVAFYFQSLVTALLVIFSPTDSVPTAWAGTLLTATLVVAAMVSKAGGNLTLHHATLVLNFATLSCISSLAVAPMLPIWRLSPGEYYEQERQRHALILGDGGAEVNQTIIESSMWSNVRKREVKRAQRRARLVLSLAILIQVLMQWAWAIYMFVSWTYSQPECNGSTWLFLFMVPFETSQINSVDLNGIYFFLWPLWLMFCLGITFTLTVILAVSSSYRSTSFSSGVSRSGSTGTRRSTTTPAIIAWRQIALEMLPSLRDTRSQLSFWCNVLSIGLWVMFVAASEMQKRKNCMFDGENDFGGLGQITAVGVSFVPLWSLAVALYKYPALRKKQREHLARAAGQASSSTDSISAAPSSSPPAPAHGSSAVSVVVIGNRRRGHAPRPSDASSMSSGEEHEMVPLAGRGHTSPRYSYVPLADPHSPPLPRRPSGPRDAPRRRHTYTRHPSGSGSNHLTP